jgi:dephospho-CoA kinase
MRQPRADRTERGCGLGNIGMCGADMAANRGPRQAQWHRLGDLVCPKRSSQDRFPRVKCHVFGLTGGLGSGKTTVAARWRARKLPVFDADELSRSVVLPGHQGLAAVIREFGQEILHEDGTLDRGKLGRIVFGNKAARKRLEEITHPFVHAALDVELRRLELREEPLACYEAPLLVETERADLFRPLVVIAAPENDQVVRAMHRDGAEEHQITARLASQAPLSAKIRLADHVIDNSGEVSHAIEQADQVLDSICRSFSIDPSRYPRPPQDAA